MQTLIVKTPAKINLSLDVVGRRADGYHLLSTIMQSIDLTDRITVGLDKSGQGIRLSCGRAPIPSDSRNTAWRAAALFREAADFASGLQIDIQKKIPSAAGLAGGSADAAAVLFALDLLLPGRLSRQHLFELAARVGADVPFCLQGGTVLCEGIGEKLTPLPAWEGLSVLLCKPNFGMRTPWVFSQFSLENPGRRPEQHAVAAAIQQQDLAALADATANVLESVSLVAKPELAAIKNHLTAAGAICSLMSGSGPTVFGLFNDPEACRAAKTALTAKLPHDTMLFTTRTLAAGPWVEKSIG